MGYAVLHLEKGSSSGGSLGNHIDRVEGKEYSYKNADPSKRNLNHNHNVNKYTQMSFNHAIESRIKDGYKSNRKLRTDAVKYCKVILSGSHEDMVKINSQKGGMNSWFHKNLEFAKKQWGAENIVRFVLHRDEKTPHIHCVFVPVTENGRLSAREIIGNKKKLESLQDAYAIEMKEFGLKRGMRGSGQKHENVSEYYARINNTKNPVTSEQIEEYQKEVEESIEKPTKIDFLNMNKYYEKNKESVKKAVSKISKKIHEDYAGIENELRNKTKELAKIKGHLHENLDNHKVLNIADYKVKYDKTGVIFSSEGVELLVGNDLINRNLNTQKFDADMKRERGKIITAVKNSILNNSKNHYDLLTLSPKDLINLSHNIVTKISNYSDNYDLKVRGLTLNLDFKFKSKEKDIVVEFTSQDYQGNPTNHTRTISKENLFQDILNNLEKSQIDAKKEIRKSKGRGYGMGGI